MVTKLPSPKSPLSNTCHIAWYCHLCVMNKTVAFRFLWGLLLLCIHLLSSCKTEHSYKTLHLRLNGHVIADTTYALHADSVFQYGLELPNRGSGDVLSLTLDQIELNESYSNIQVYFRNKRYANREQVGFERPTNYVGSALRSDTFIVRPTDKGELHLALTSSPVGGKRFTKTPAHLTKNQLVALESKRKAIANTPEWLEAIRQKAQGRGVNLRTQLEHDARFMYTSENQMAWPAYLNTLQMGEYEFMVVAATDHGLTQVPEELRDLKRNGINKNLDAFNYFTQNRAIEGVAVYLVESEVAVFWNVPLNTGIYINPEEAALQSLDTTHFSSQCGADITHFDNALFEQFFHSKVGTVLQKNVNLVADYRELNAQDLASLKSMPEASFIEARLSNADCPCRDIRTTEEGLELRNPGFATTGKKVKQNIGVKSRVPTTYGRYLFEIEFPEHLSESQAWSGLTNAIWLVSDFNFDNYRGPCFDRGYLPRVITADNRAGQTDSTIYSEIDFEIVYDRAHWPSTSYTPEQWRAVDTTLKPGEIVVTTTNWDMGCFDPPQYSVGNYQACTVKGDTCYDFHRWDHDYQATTSKAAVQDDAILGKTYFYEIDWSPTQIVWRIGPTAQQLQTIAVLTDEYSQIPDNAMNIVITQEFHHGSWWPDAPQSQEFVPFPKNDIKGVIKSIRIY